MEQNKVSGDREMPLLSRGINYLYQKELKIAQIYVWRWVPPLGCEPRGKIDGLQLQEKMLILPTVDNVYKLKARKYRHIFSGPFPHEFDPKNVP